MARIRTIKPGMRTSEVVCSWPYVVRWTFTGLLTYVDDAGRAVDNTRLLKAELYPLDDDITPSIIEEHLSLIAAGCQPGDSPSHDVAGGPLCRYEVDGRRYLHLVNFEEHQRVNRPTPSKIPPCPKHESSHCAEGARAHVALIEDSVSPPPRNKEGNKEEEGNKEVKRLSLKSSNRPDLDAAFAQFWEVYPRKVDKLGAAKAFERACRSTDPVVIIAGAKIYAASRAGQDQKFTKHPPTWLNRGCWSDETPRVNGHRPAYELWNA